jgi:hypothetical protein
MLAVVAGVFAVAAALAGAWGAGAFSSQNQSGTSTGASSTGPLMPGDASAFISDVTYPDYSRVYAGSHFAKIWELRNSGSVKWAGRYLAALGPSSGGCKYPSRVAIPITDPGSTTEISVNVTASASPGTCDVTWKMVTSTGQLYFPNDSGGIWFKVVVVARKKSS